MKTENLKKLLFATAVVVLSACGSPTEKPKALSTSELDEKAPAPQSQQGAEHPGKKVYTKYCKACHQTNGMGVASIFPPLSPNEFIKDKQKMIDIVLHGMKGKIEVDGETYNGLMTPHSHLTNQEIADVISYVRSNFGNELESVTAEEVQAAR
ncbi:c-type cytochrome [Mangrovibacterium diazotrophicum]|uniref:Mono/diheme cytochrome c family protein n=1 Tax=Mangrovibacterium diazotrophicum TaxID=1261403 RepID=A0A419VWK3_9BACT|nr:cytochrome c [Mangrovibacterium diazotrophicum]RKD86488.1 mono/diheme cytochrome c family protein [Mangrovibacterium diazotrophicum]